MQMSGVPVTLQEFITLMGVAEKQKPQYIQIKMIYDAEQNIIVVDPLGAFPIVR